MISHVTLSPRMLIRTVITTIQILFILLWIYAAVNKLIDFSQFKFQLGRSPYVTNIAGFVVWALPVSELGIAALLLFKKTTTLGMYASFFLMLLFTGYIYAMQHYSYFVPCSCGGILNNMSWNTHFYFNIIFTLFALTGIVLQRIYNDLPNKINQLYTAG